MHPGQYPALGQMTVGNILQTAAARFGGREALYCAGTGRRFSFRQLHDRGNRLANALLGLSLERDAVVAFICSNRAEILDIYVALARSGLVGLPLNYRLAPAEMATLIESMGAVAVVCEARFADAAAYLRQHVTGLRRFLWIGSDAPEGFLDYDALLETADPGDPGIEVDEHAPYYFNLTSGTTGLPKSYVLTQYTCCNLHAGLLAQDARPDDVSLSLFPAFGRVGLGSLLMSIAIGARNVLVNFDPARALGLIEEESVTFVWLVPTMAALMMEIQAQTPRDLGSLRGIGFVGAMLPAAIRDRAMELLCPHLYEGYGLQEIGMLTISNPTDRARHPDSVGLPLLFSEVRIVDAAGRSLPAGEIGEIVGRSPNGITAYHNSPERSAEAFRNGWFHTGDLGRLDADGYLYICGRVKDMIITGGQNVHAAEIEAALLEHPQVRECAVIGLPHEVWGETVTAVVIAVAGASLEIEQLQEFCRRTLAGFKVPRRVVFQDDPLPRTPTGKVQKFLLVERHRDDSTAG